VADLPIPCLTLVTDLTLLPKHLLVQQVSKAVAAGVDIVQLREKNMPDTSLFPLAQELRKITRGQALLLINNSVDLALECEADGVQLGWDAMPLREVRKIAGRRNNFLLGRSIHSTSEAIAAQKDGADFLLVGTIFHSRSHPEEEPAGVRLLTQVDQVTNLPFFAIGGILPGNVPQVMRAGAKGIAVIEAILGATDPVLAVTKLRHAMDSVQSHERLIN
jgi:thiamine-phosphate pyrophosphorylase